MALAFSLLLSGCGGGGGGSDSQNATNAKASITEAIDNGFSGLYFKSVSSNQNEEYFYYAPSGNYYRFSFIENAQQWRRNTLIQYWEQDGIFIRRFSPNKEEFPPGLFYNGEGLYYYMAELYDDADEFKGDGAIHPLVEVRINIETVPKYIVGQIEFEESGHAFDYPLTATLLQSQSWKISNTFGEEGVFRFDGSGMIVHLSGDELSASLQSDLPLLTQGDLWEMDGSYLVITAAPEFATQIGAQAWAYDENTKCYEINVQLNYVSTVDNDAVFDAFDEAAAWTFCPAD